MKTFFLILVMLGNTHLAYSFSNDPYLNKQWSLFYSEDKGGANAVKAWESFDQKHKIRVAVIECGGVDLDHEDLKNKIAINRKEIPNNGLDDDGNGYIDDHEGYNATRRNGDVRLGPPCGGLDHGTHVSGIIAAEHNNIGIAGVASNVEILVIKPEWDGNKNHWQRDLARAIEYAVDVGAHIINLSLPSYGDTPALRKMIEKAKKKGVIIVASAGNSSHSNGEYPADYSKEFTNVISVASSRKDVVKSYFSNYGAENVTIFAPGSDIYSTISNNKYGYLSGTSMSTPVVSGVIALVLSINGPKFSLNIKERLVNSCHRFEKLSGKVYSNGLIDAYNAITGQTSLNFVWK